MQAAHLPRLLASRPTHIIDIDLMNIESPNGPEEPESAIDIAAIQLLSPEVINLDAIRLSPVHDERVIDISAIQLERDTPPSTPLESHADIVGVPAGSDADATARQAAFTAVWLASCEAASPPNQNAPVPPWLDARTVQYFNMANTTREWKPSRLVVRDCQRTIQRAYGDIEVMLSYGDMLKKSCHGLEKIRRELYKY